MTDEIEKYLYAQKNYRGFKIERIDRFLFCIEEGMKPQVLKKILGHSSLAMTMDLYSHVLPDVKAEEMDKISGGF